MRNNNQKVIRRLSGRSFKKNRMRNLFAIIAIALTALLFTTLFSLGSGVIQITEEQTMRQVGSRAHAGLKSVTWEQYERITSHPLVKEHGYNILIGVATNKELAKRQTEIRYTEEKDIELGFVRLKEGKFPTKENEIVIDTIVMDLLGLEHKLGVEVPLNFEFMGETKEEAFTVSGWYEGDPVSMASQVYLSKAYLEQISTGYTQEDFVEAFQKYFVGAGLIQGNIMYSNSNNIEEKTYRIITESGYAVDEISVGINWAYLSQMTQELDFVSLMIIAVVFFVMMLTGYLIIYNIFQISIIGDIRFYGLLKTIGATKKQIRRLVLRQAFILSCIGIPIGLLVGYFAGIGVMPILLGFTELQYKSFELKANPYIFLLGALFSMATVFISCRKPSKIAGSVSPIEATKYSEVSKIKRKAKKSKRGARLYAIALSNLKRSKKKTFVTILSLSLSVIVLMEVVTFSNSFSIDQYLERMLTGDFTICPIALTNYRSGTELELSEDLYEAASSQQGIESDSRMYHSNSRIDHTLSTKGNQRFRELYEKGLLKVYEGKGSNLPSIQKTIKDNTPITETRFAYDELLLNKLEVLDGDLDLEEFKSGNYILVVPYVGLDIAYYKPGDKVKLQYHNENSVQEEVYDDSGTLIDYVWANDTVKEYEVMAIVDIPYSMTTRRFSPNALTTILPVEELLANDIDAACFAVSYLVEDDKEAAFQSFLENYTTTIDPNTDFESKEELRDELSTYSKSINIIGGALSFVVAIVGILNFINTMLTSVITRKRELAMMQSIGLTDSQLKRMLVYEGLYYIAFSAVISIVVGTLLSISTIRAFNNIAVSFEYQFTIMPFVVMLPVFLIIGILVPGIAYRKAKKLSIIERLREGE